MMTELLIVKDGDSYYRFSEGQFYRCSMNKASVFPLDRLNEARSLCNQVRATGVAANLMKLSISEEPFME
jgi:hypothetical protein